RLFIRSDVPPEQSLEWSDAGVEGANRFLRKFWQVIYRHQQASAGVQLPLVVQEKLDDMQQALRKQTHASLRKASDDIERRHTFNTAISSIRELSNAITRFTVRGEHQLMDLAVEREAIVVSLKLLQAITPHFSEHLLQVFNENINSWPQFDESTQTQSTQEIVLQVNGKVREKIHVAVDIDKDTLEKLALAEEKVQK